MIYFLVQLEVKNRRLFAGRTSSNSGLDRTQLWDHLQKYFNIQTKINDVSNPPAPEKRPRSRERIAGRKRLFTLKKERSEASAAATTLNSKSLEANRKCDEISSPLPNEGVEVQVQPVQTKPQVDLDLRNRVISDHRSYNNVPTARGDTSCQESESKSYSGATATNSQSVVTNHKYDKTNAPLPNKDIEIQFQPVHPMPHVDVDLRNGILSDHGTYNQVLTARRDTYWQESESKNYSRAIANNASHNSQSVMANFYKETSALPKEGVKVPVQPVHPMPYVNVDLRNRVLSDHGSYDQMWSARSDACCQKSESENYSGLSGSMPYWMKSGARVWPNHRDEERSGEDQAKESTMSLDKRISVLITGRQAQNTQKKTEATYSQYGVY